MRVSLACAGLLLMAATLAAEGASIDQLSWMEGLWVGGGGEAPQTEELWLTPRGGVMLGLHRDVGPGDRLFFEFLRIAETADGLVYFASPKGREATAFGMVEMAPGRVVFENPDHDFPQRIGYRLEGEDTLVAWIEGEIEGEKAGSEWRWVRSSGAAAHDE
ncbi:MAG: DUF6265 family protein [Acidobacteriota bacterium]|nr:DUF6265 family protein [Acidobacteriota bacterium]